MIDANTAAYEARTINLTASNGDELLQHADILPVNKTEAAQPAAKLNILTSRADIALAIGQCPHSTVRADSQFERQHSKVTKIKNTIPGTAFKADNTVGAGDNFAGYLCSRLEHRDSWLPTATSLATPG